MSWCRVCGGTVLRDGNLRWFQKESAGISAVIVQIDKARHPGDVANARCLFDRADDAGFIDSNAGVIPDSVCGDKATF